MSNLLNNQIGQALTTVGNVLQQQELTEFNTLRGAKLSLYHAHSITAKAEGELREHQEQSQKAAEQSKIAAIGVNATANVAVAAKSAVMDTSTTTSNAAACAASVQKAANALTALSGNIAATLAVANTLDKGSKIQRLVERADKAMKDAAKLAEKASVTALNLTIEVSQSRAASVVSQAEDVKSKMVTLQKSLSGTFGKQQDLIAADQEALDSAIGEESQQAGIYKTALAEDNALRQSTAFINQYINNNLTISINEFGRRPDPKSNLESFKLSFTPFKGAIANDISEYRLIIVKADDAVAFNLESAKSTPEKNYAKLSNAYSQSYILADLSLEEAPMEVNKIAIDYAGHPVVRGVPYKFFLYVIYTPEYQSEYNDTNGLLSLPSDSFTLRTALPTVSASSIAMAFYQKKGADSMRLIFKVPKSQMMLSNGSDLNDLMEFRTFLFNAEDQLALSRNNFIDQQAQSLFQLEDTFRLSEEKYLDAKQKFEEALSDVEQKVNVMDQKKKLEDATANYQNAKLKYNNQKAAFDGWTEAKISDFAFDVEIAQTIPASNYSTATLNPDLFNEWDQLSEIADGYTSKVDSNKTNLTKLSTEYDELTKKIENVEKPVKDKIQQAQKNIESKIEALESKLNRDFAIKSVEDASNFKEALVKDDKDDKYKIEIGLLEDIIKEFDTLLVQESELAKLIDVAKWRNKQKELNTDMVLLRAEQGMLQDELTSINGEKLALDSLKAKLSQEDDSNFAYYQVVNEAGDFTDNFGEPLVVGDSYCVAVLSTIKATEPDAAPIFKSSLSDFSTATPFLLTQI